MVDNYRGQSCPPETTIHFGNSFTMTRSLFAFLILPLSLFAGNPQSDWTSTKGEVRRFVENKAQFDPLVLPSHAPVLYGVDLGKTKILFTKQGLTFRFDEHVRNTKRVKGSADPKFFVKTDFVYMQWENANPNVQVLAEERTPDYFSYLLRNNESVNFVKGYEKLVYKDLYPNIDVEYVFHPQGGIKYSIILRPGADPSQIKMKYEDTDRIKLDAEGNARFSTMFGDIVDHAPLTFYADDKNSIIASAFSEIGNEVSFSLGKYNKSKTVVIDPWSQTPNFPATNWDCIWECERDGSGNVYVIGGTSPLQLIKYNSAGFIQWTYSTPYDTTEWLGTFATDLAGNSYVTEGSQARIQKISTAGTVVWNNPNPGGIFSLTEFWNITFNCDQTKLIIGGTGGNALGGTPIPYIYDVDMTSGNITQSLQATGVGAAFAIPPNIQEVRSVASCGNARYYFLTHDSIGYVHQNLSTCLQGGQPFHINSGADLSYKCEDYRYDNSGIMALSYYSGFVYMHRGNQLQKRTFSTAAIVATANIPGGSYSGGFGGSVIGCSGIDIDACGNIYVGSTTGIHKFDQSLNLLTSYPTTFNVYDVEVNSGGEVIGCGSTGTSTSASRAGSIQSFAAGACATQSLVCCDATICNVSPLCNPGPSVTLTASTSGGTWSGTGVNPTTGVFDPTVAGNGTFTITYSIACGSESIPIVVKSCASPTVCLEGNGDLTASGGAGNYHWEVQGTASNCTACLFPALCQPPAANCPQIVTTWTTYSTSTTATPPGTFPIQLVDGSGNILVINSLAGISACSNMSVSTTSTSITCNGQCTGTSTVTVTGGTAPFTYSWNTTPVQTTQVASGLCAGTYTVTVTDATPGTTTALVTITQPAAMTLSVTTGTASCSGSNGSATVTPSGGTSAYTYAWNNGQTAQTATGLAAGSYSATVTDANGCTATTVANVSNTGVPQANISPVTNVSCNGGSDGAATVNVTVGTAPYTYVWNPGGQTTSAVSGLSAGNYQVTVTDAGGCIVIVTTTVTAPTALTATATATNSNCAGSPGTGYVTASGGTPGYSYSWSPGGQTSSIATGLNSGSYSVTVTDLNGCTIVQSITVTQPTAFSASVSVVGTNCGTSIGSASVSASGGTGTLTYSWSPGGQTVPSISNLAAGTYSCTITDANGCTQLVTAVVSNLNGPSATINGQVNNICNGGMIGTASANATGGSFPYTYGWNTTPSQNTATATGLAAGMYVVTVTDATGCTNTQTVTITEPAPITASVVVTQASCGQSDGTASVTASAGLSPYTYLWNTSVSSSLVTGLAAGSYSVLITDANGCTQTATALVTNANGPTAVAGVSTTITSGNSAQLNASGGVTYSWSPATGLSDPNISNPVASPDQTTEYCVYVTDTSGCTDSACVTVYVEEPCTNTWYLPNAFSPNNDGENDVFKTYFPNLSCIKEYKLGVYDRWGELIFETTDPADSWDGSYIFKAMDTQVLTYYLHILFVDGTLVDERGNVSMLR